MELFLYLGNCKIQLNYKVEDIESSMQSTKVKRKLHTFWWNCELTNTKFYGDGSYFIADPGNFQLTIEPEFLRSREISLAADYYTRHDETKSGANFGKLALFYASDHDESVVSTKVIIIKRLLPSKCKYAFILLN